MKTVKRIGNVITALALVFLVWRVSRFDIAWGELLTPAHALMLALCVGLYTLLVLLGYLPWMKLAGLFTDAGEAIRRHRGLLIRIYTRSNILKYLPGNVFQYVGRNELAVSMGLDHVNVATATVTEILLTALAALLTAALLVGSFTLEYLSAHLLQFALLCGAGVAVLGAVGCFAFRRWRNRMAAYMRQYKRALKSRAALTTVAFCLCFYMLTFLWCGAVFLATMHICGGAAWSAESVRVLLGAYTLSWLAGYITPGSPGGIGVRELILTTVVAGSGIASEDVVVAAALVNRLVSILGDLLAFLIAALCFRGQGASSEKEGKG